MPTSVKRFTTLLTVLVMLNGNTFTFAEITLTFDIHGTGTGSAKNTKETSENDKQIASIINTSDSIKAVNQMNDTGVFEPVIISDNRVYLGSDANKNDTGDVILTSDGLNNIVHQRKDKSDLKPIVVNHRNVERLMGINENLHSDGRLLPISTVSKVHEAIKPLIQTKDVKDVIPVISASINVSDNNITIDKGTPVSAISTRQETIRDVNKDEKTGHLLPVKINDTSHTNEITISEKQNPISHVSKSNTSIQINQSEDTNGIRPINISNVRNVNSGTSQGKSIEELKTFVSRAQDTIGQLNQSKDTNHIKPFNVVHTRNMDNEAVINEIDSMPKILVSKANSTIGQVNQSKDNNDIKPVNFSHTRKVINSSILNEIKAIPKSFVSRANDTIGHVFQRKDTNDIRPVHDKFTKEVNRLARVTETEVMPKTFVSRVQDKMGQVNQSKDKNEIIPVNVNGSRNVNNDTNMKKSNALTMSVSRQQDTIGQVNQSKDANYNINPDLYSTIELNVDNSSTLNKITETESIISSVSYINSTKQKNQSNDNGSILPVITNATNVNKKVNISEENVQVSVAQATDKGVLQPVETNITYVKEIVYKGNDIKDFNITIPPPLIAVDDKVQPLSAIPSVDLNKRYNSIGTEYCISKSRCNSTMPSKSCYCDSLCIVLNDCCEDAEIVQSPSLDSNQLTCTHVSGISDFADGLMVVSKCFPTWKDNVTRKLCENEIVSEDIYSRIPVSDQTVDGILYKNRHCAHCNNAFKYQFLKADVKCATNKTVVDISDIGDCKLSFQMPNVSETFRTCNTYTNIISDCETSFTGDEIREKCEKDYFSKTYTNKGYIYRNKYCAICNGVNLRTMYCQPHFSAAVERVQPTLVYSFRMIVDFNSRWEARNEQIKPFSECKDNEIYDPFSKNCREIFCPPYTIPMKGKCEPVSQNIDIINNKTMFNTTENCTLTIIEGNNIKFSNDTNVIIFRNIIFNKTEFWKNGSDIFVCLEKLNISTASNTSKLRNIYPYSTVESYVSLIGLILSITASLVTLFVYIMFPKQLLNTPGKNVMCLIISLLVSQVLFLVASKVATMHYFCVSIAILMHYFFLCSFCWMNVIAFDLWVTFSNKFVSIRHQSSNSRRFLYYSLYAWCLPLLIVGIADILNFVNFNGKSTNSFVPKYGNGVCWITSRNALLLFFAGPLAIFKVFDFISFGFTAYHITRARSQGTFARKGTSVSNFVINLRLSIVMGLTWAFAFLANFTNNTVMWYLFIICNTLQGLFIAISFLCTRKVLRLFQEKYENNFSRSSDTQMTTRPSYKSSE